MTTKTSNRYRTLAVTRDVSWKLDIWQAYLSKRWKRRVTVSQTIDYLIDSMGTPPEGKVLGDD